MAVLIRGLVLAAVLAAPAAADPRALLDAQLAVIDDPAALAKTLAPDAVILGNGSFTLARGDHAPAILATLAASRSHLPALQTSVTRFASGASQKVEWLDAEIAMAHSVVVPRRRVIDVTRARIVELAVQTGGAWRVVAIAFASSSGLGAASDALGPADTGPLVKILATRLGAKVTAAVEVHGEGWGIVAGDVTTIPRAWWEPARDDRVLLLALGDRAGWNVVAIASGSLADPPIEITP